MKVIMQKDVKGVGRAGEVCEVSDGFALNALIPQGKAVQATPERIAAHAARSREKKAAEEAQRAEDAARVKALKGTSYTFAVRASEKGGLFKSITEREIAERLHLPQEAVILDHPIKTVGEHSILVVYAGERVTLTIRVEAA
jgi:large subunit ribosomal protein L9